MLTNRPDGHKGECAFTFGGSAAGLSAEDGLVGGRSRVHRLVPLLRPGLLGVVRRDALPGDWICRDVARGIRLSRPLRDFP